MQTKPRPQSSLWFLLLLALLLAPSLAGVLPRPALAQTPPVDIVAPGDQVFVDDSYAYSDRVRSGQLSVVSEFRLSMVEGELVTIETANISEGGDPVLHLLDARSGQELAVDKDSAGGTAARVVYRTGEARDVIVVVRSLRHATAGTADLLKNGEPWKSGVTFAGWHNEYTELLAGEQLHTVHLPNGAASPHRIYVIDNVNGFSIATRATGGGPHGAAIARIGQDIGKPTAIAAVAKAEDAETVRLLRNDIMTDSDGDGLGDRLEAALGTCSSRSGYVRGPNGYEFDCSLIADPRDTDGDGIPDGLEVLGRLVNNEVLATGATAADTSAELQALPGDVYANPFHEHLNLPMWGADPRHKDLFIEVDFMMRSPNETPLRLSANVARQFAAYYQDTLDDPHPIVDLYRAVTLQNPDGKRGINVHLDTGRAPERPEDATVYGDWGGYNAVPPVQKEDGSWVGANPQQAWKDNMSPARRGIFRYLMIYPTGGGQNPMNAFAGSGPADNAWVLAHEFGHAMGLGHSGVTPGPVDPNCKPNYPSLMNYAFQSNPQIGFSDGVGAPSLNNVALKEWKAVSPSDTAYLDVLENTFKYYVDREHGHVDWNRDGEIAPEGTTVRAYANYKPGGGGCEFTRYNQSTIPDAASTTAPAMARLGNRLYVFYSVLGAVFYTYSTDAGNCPKADITACATWSDRGTAFMDAQGGIDVVRVGAGADAALLVVTIDNNGNLWERRLSLDGSGNERWSDHKQIAGAAAKSEPSLSDLGYCKIFLSYRGSDGNVRYNRLSCADRFRRWQGEQLALDQDGNPIAMADYASPGIGRAYLGEPGWASIYGAFADVNGRLDLYRFNEGANRWEKTDLLESRPGPIEGRPALAWTSEHTDIDYPGKFYLMYIRHDTTPGRGFREQQREVRMMTSYVKVDRQPDGSLTKTLKVGLNGPFDNVWLYAFGIDLFFEAGVDSNLRMVQSIAINKQEVWATIQFRPKADGIHDFLMTDFNDWEVMRIGLCKHVVNPGGLVSNPITCHSS